MIKVDEQQLFSRLMDSDMERDLQRHFLEMARAINELAEETEAKRYSYLMSAGGGTEIIGCSAYGVSQPSY